MNPILIKNKINSNQDYWSTLSDLNFFNKSPLYL